MLPSRVSHVSTASGSMAELAHEVAADMLCKLSLQPSASAGQFVDATSEPGLLPLARCIITMDMLHLHEGPWLQTGAFLTSKGLQAATSLCDMYNLLQIRLCPSVGCGRNGSRQPHQDLLHSTLQRSSLLCLAEQPEMLLGLVSLPCQCSSCLLVPLKRRQKGCLHRSQLCCPARQKGAMNRLLCRQLRVGSRAATPQLLWCTRLRCYAVQVARTDSRTLCAINIRAPRLRCCRQGAPHKEELEATRAKHHRYMT